MKANRVIWIVLGWLILPVYLFSQALEVANPPQKILTKESNYTVYFRVGKDEIEPSFRSNLASMNNFVRELRQLPDSLELKKIYIASGASPEGSYDLNRRLANRRGEGLRRYLRQVLSLKDLTFEVVSVGQDWKRLYELVEQSYIECRDDVLFIINDEPAYQPPNVEDTRTQRLRKLCGGRPWNYMNRNFFDELRSATIVKYEVGLVEEYEPPTPTPTPTPAPEPVVITETIVERDTVMVEVEKVVRDTTLVVLPVRDNTTFISLKTNMLYNLALIPNIQLEYLFTDGWTIGGTYHHAWWHNDPKHHYWRLYGGELNLRNYFGGQAEQKPMTGHHWGVYAQILSYDFELGGRGYLSHFSYGGGVEYGYSVPIAPRLSLDFSLGLGYIGGAYKVYDPMNGHYVWQETRQRNWFGPTKAEITLIWHIGSGYKGASRYSIKKQSRKGGFEL